MKTKIRLKNIKLYGWHGISDKEKEIGQQFEIDIEVTAPQQSTKNLDNIKHSIDLTLIFSKWYFITSFLSNIVMIRECITIEIVKS